MKYRRSFWFTIDLKHPLSSSESYELMEEVTYWDFGTFLVIHSNILMSANRLHELLDGILSESPLAVCIADNAFSILERLEVHFNS